MRLDAKIRGDALAAAGRGLGDLVQLRAAAGGGELSRSDRDALLAKAVARESVSVVGEFLAFEQRAGVPNRKYVRFREGALLAVGRTGRGKPFLRDHDQWDVRARGGTVLDSATTKVTDGHYEIRQTIEITEPAAVERALRGLMSSVSIGWHPTGPVLCSACGTEVLSTCWHWPGDEIRLDGGAESVCIEWIYTAAELVETSEVSVPAVPGAGLEKIKASLAATMTDGDRAGHAHGEKRMDKIKLALLGLLGLAATASDDEVIDAVSKTKRERDALAASNTELAAMQVRLVAESEATKAAAKQRDTVAFLAEQVQAGKCSAGSPLEASLRDFYTVDPDGAKKLAASLPRITLVGVPPQRDAGGGAAPSADGKLAAAAERIAQHSPRASLEGVRRAMLALGHSPAKADEIIARQLAPKEGAPQ